MIKLNKQPCFHVLPTFMTSFGFLLQESSIHWYLNEEIMIFVWALFLSRILLKLLQDQTFKQESEWDHLGCIEFVTSMHKCKFVSVMNHLQQWDAAVY
jgi:predicted membrane channel-forming protein YqfA (hemolysin III family)